MSSIKTLKGIGFKYLTDVSIDQTGLLEVNKSNMYNQVYAICIDQSLVYIGKTKKWQKRWDTYRNVVNWSSGHLSNIKKTSLLTEAIKQGKTVKIFYKQAIFNYNFKDFDNNDLIVSTLSEEEKRLIKKFKPKWNVHYV